MTGWDVLNSIINVFPPIAAACLLAAAGVIFIIGFSRHGMNFLKYGFKQIIVNDLIEKLATKEDISRIDDRFVKLEAKIEAVEVRLETKIEAVKVNLETKIEAIEVNHFGDLKDYLGILNGILLDKNIIDNETKARLDNELRGM